MAKDLSKDITTGHIVVCGKYIGSIYKDHYNIGGGFWRYCKGGGWPHSSVGYSTSFEAFTALVADGS